MSDNFGELTLTNRDNPEDVIDKVNALLREHGMEFVLEDESEPGYAFYMLTLAR